MPTFYGIPIWLLVPLGFFAVSGLFFGLSILASYFEKRPVWPYAEIDPNDPAEPPRITYHKSQARHAETKGFDPAGTCKDAKGKLYKVRYEFWLSPERDVLMMVGGGTIKGMPVEATWLYTPIADGRMAVSTDKQLAMESAPGDPWEWKLLIDARLPELLAWHRDRAAGMFARVDPFEPQPDRALARMAKLRRDRVDGFLARGLARHRDDQGNAWSFSAQGSVRLMLRTYFKGLFDAMTQPFRTVKRGSSGTRKTTGPGAPGNRV